MKQIMSFFLLLSMLSMTACKSESKESSRIGEELEHFERAIEEKIVQEIDFGPDPSDG